MNSKYDAIVSRRQLPVVLEVDEFDPEVAVQGVGNGRQCPRRPRQCPFATVKPWLRDLQRVERHLKGACHFEGF
jgi:hypothetical protein